MKTTSHHIVCAWRKVHNEDFFQDIILQSDHPNSALQPLFPPIKTYKKVYAQKNEQAMNGKSHSIVWSGFAPKSQSRSWAEWVVPYGLKAGALRGSLSLPEYVMLLLQRMSNPPQPKERTFISQDPVCCKHIQISFLQIQVPWNRTDRVGQRGSRKRRKKKKNLEPFASFKLPSSWTLCLF